MTYVKTAKLFERSGLLGNNKENEIIINLILDEVKKNVTSIGNIGMENICQQILAIRDTPQVRAALAELTNNDAHEVILYSYVKSIVGEGEVELQNRLENYKFESGKNIPRKN